MATTVIAILTYQYVQYSKRQWETMERGLSISNQSIMTADGAVMAANEANEIARGALEAARSQQRAWVILTIAGTYELVPGKETIVQISQKNYGRNPALKVSLGYGVRTFVVVPDKLPAGQHSGYAGVIAPEGEIAQLAGVTFTKELGEAIRAGKSKLLIHGKIAYTDRSGTQGVSTICREYNPEFRQFVFCPGHPDEAR